MPIITSYSLANSVSGALNTLVTAGDQARPTVVARSINGDWFAAWDTGGAVIHAPYFSKHCSLVNTDGDILRRAG